MPTTRKPTLKAVNLSGGHAEHVPHTIRYEGDFLTEWDLEHYKFIHLGFQEYPAVRVVRMELPAEKDIC